MNADKRGFEAEQNMRFIGQNLKSPFDTAIAMFSCAVVVLCLGHQAAADSIRLLEQAGSAGPAVTLNQIAELEGDYADTLGELVVGRFAEGQDALQVQLATVRRVLGESQVNWSDLSLRGRSNCTVTRLREEKAVDEAMIVNDRALTTNNELAVDQANANQQVSDLLVAKLVELNETSVDELRVTFRGGADEAAWLNRSVAVGRFEVESLSRSGLGRVPMRVRRFDAAGTVEEVTLTAEVTRRVIAVVARRQLRRGEVFSSENVELREVWLEADHGETLDTVDLLLGQSSSSALREGGVVLADHVAPDVLVRRGDLVTVTCVSGMLVVRFTGRASGNGVKGDIIAVRHPETRETFYATVSGKNQATITSGTTDQTLASNEDRR